MQPKRVVTSAAVLLLMLSCCQCCVMNFETENGDIRKGEVMYRSKASGGFAVHLKSTRTVQYVIHTFSTTSTCSVMVKDVRYSNDGLHDTIEILLDGEVLGSFRTRAASDRGELWNVFVSTDNVGKSLQIPPGEHELQFAVLSTDEYGVELDKSTLQLTCEGLNIGEDTICPARE